MAMTTNVPTMKKLQPGKGERHFFSTSDDNVMTKQIQATHIPDGREVDVKPLLNVVENILQQASIDGILHATTQAQFDAIEEKAHQEEIDGMLEALAYTIHKISCEISCKCSGGVDDHTTTMTVLNTLSSYSWEAKVVLALAAFAVNYGEFWLVAQLYLTNRLAKSIACLKQLPEMFAHKDMLKPRFDSIKALIKAMMDVTKCIINFKELPTQYINADTPVMSDAMAHIPTAVYWTIKSIVSCSSQMISFIGLGHEYMSSTTEAWELSGLAHKVTNIHGHLQSQLKLCYQHIDEKKHVEAFNILVHLFETIHIDNMKVLKIVLGAQDNVLPLFDCSTKTKVSLEVLRRKTVLLLISDLDFSDNELVFLDQIYKETKAHPNKTESYYEIVWLPVVDMSTPWSDAKEEQFVGLQNLMSWYSVLHPSVLDRAVIKYIKEFWRFEKKPIVVALDPQGKVVNINALHMIWIWASLAFPFTTVREEGLWKAESWKLELLVDSLDPLIVDWMTHDTIICLYGGEDLEWIRKFTALVRNVSQVTGLTIEMAYVGKSNPKERVRKIVGTIALESLSHCWQDLRLIWFFWVRLESMWYSKLQHGKTKDNDPIMQEILTMLTLSGSHEGWAVIGRGIGEMTKAQGDQMLTSLSQVDEWKDRVPEKGIVQALEEHLHEHKPEHHCNRLILPGIHGGIPEMVVCAECGKPMEKYFMYQCCDE